MKTQEVIDLILKEREAGKTDAEITETLKGQEKIGNAKTTDEVIASLLKRAVNTKPGDPPIVDDEGDEATTPTPPAGKKVGPVYEKWKVEIDHTGKVTAKVKKIKDVKISDGLAEMLNKAGAQGNGFAVKYYKK